MQYAAPTGCGSEQEVLDKFWQAWGADGRELPQVTAVVIVTAEGQSVRVAYRASVEGRESRRELVVESCGAATEAAALLLVLTADPLLIDTLGGSSVVPEPAGQVDPGAPPEPDPTLEGASPPLAEKASSGGTPGGSAEQGRSTAVRGWVGVAGDVASSLAPSWAFGPSVDLGLGLGLLEVGLRGAVRVAPSVEASSAPGVELRSLLGEGQVWAGPSLRANSMRFTPYLGLGLELLTIQPSGAVEGRTGSSPFLLGSLGCRFLWAPRGSIGVLARAGASFPLERPEFVLAGVEGPVFQPGVVSFDGSLGVFVRFGAAQ